MSSPKIRFKGFSDDWEQRKLGEVCVSFEYGLNAAAKDYDGENKYIRITDIDDETRVFLQSNLTTPDFSLEYADNYLLQKGDIVFARTGASVGKTYIYRENDGKVYYAGFLIRARIKPEYNAEFVFQNTLTMEYEKYIKITSQRSGQPGINAQEYAEYAFFAPQIEEQMQIGGFFRSLDTLITLHQCKQLFFTKIVSSLKYSVSPNIDQFQAQQKGISWIKSYYTTAVRIRKWFRSLDLEMTGMITAGDSI